MSRGSLQPVGGALDGFPVAFVCFCVFERSPIELDCENWTAGNGEIVRIFEIGHSSTRKLKKVARGSR